MDLVGGGGLTIVNGQKKIVGALGARLHNN